MSYLRLYRELAAFLLALLCSAACAAQTEIPTKQGRPSDAASASENNGPASGFAASEAQLRRDLESHPDSATILYQLGKILRFENKPKESLEIYTQAARLQRPDAEELRSVALDYVLLNDYADAIHWLEVAVSLYPQSPELYYSLGRCPLLLLREPFSRCRDHVSQDASDQARSLEGRRESRAGLRLRQSTGKGRSRTPYCRAMGWSGVQG
jgi:tetratricopeptide (TPR) repeat protein